MPIPTPTPMSGMQATSAMRLDGLRDVDPGWASFLGKPGARGRNVVGVGDEGWAILRPASLRRIGYVEADVSRSW